MNAYLDLMLINQFMMNLGAFHFVKVLTCSPAERGRSIGLSILFALLVFGIYLPPLFSYLLSIGAHALIFAAVYKRKFLERLLTFWCFLAATTLFSRLLFQDYTAMRHQILVITSAQGAWLLLLAPVLYLLVDASALIVDRLYRLRDYKTTILMTSGSNRRIVSAYFDSGNTLRLSNDPVIFVKQGKFDFAPADEVKDVPINPLTIRYPVVRLYKVLVNVGRKQASYFVYAAEVTTDADFYGCDILLNAFLRG